MELMRRARRGGRGSDEGAYHDDCRPFRYARRPSPSATQSASLSEARTEIDTRLLGMLAALAVIWLGFHILSGGTFLTAAQPLEPVGPEHRRSRSWRPAWCWSS